MGQDLTGRVLDAKYRIERKIGEGSMGAVWAARQVPLDRPVAVKVLHAPFVGDPEAVRRFQQEAIAAGRVGSPHIVEILDLGRTPEGAPYLAMEYLRGRELSELLGEQPVLPPARAADIVCQVLRGVGAAHAKGIIHRDLKPENVFLVTRFDGSELVKLVDFGLAKVETDAPAAQITKTGMVLGTPHTMSPEQVMGRKDVDARADVWSAGVLLFRLLAGRYPHAASQLTELLTQIVTEDAPTLRSVRPELDAGLEALVARALSRDRDGRFASAAAFEKALAPYTRSVALADTLAVPWGAVGPGPRAPAGRPSAAPQPRATTPAASRAPSLAPGTARPREPQAAPKTSADPSRAAARAAGNRGRSSRWTWVAGIAAIVAAGAAVGLWFAWTAKHGQGTATDGGARSNAVLPPGARPDARVGPRIVGPEASGDAAAVAAALLPAGSGPGADATEDSALTAEDRENYIAIEANAWCLALEIAVQQRIPMSDATLAEGRRRARRMMSVDGRTDMLAAGAYRSSVVVRAEIRRRARAICGVDVVF